MGKNIWKKSTILGIPIMLGILCFMPLIIGVEQMSTKTMKWGTAEQKSLIGHYELPIVAKSEKVTCSIYTGQGVNKIEKLFPLKTVEQLMITLKKGDNKVIAELLQNLGLIPISMSLEEVGQLIDEKYCTTYFKDIAIDNAVQSGLNTFVKPIRNEGNALCFVSIEGSWYRMNYFGILIAAWIVNHEKDFPLLYEIIMPLFWDYWEIENKIPLRFSYPSLYCFGCGKVQTKGLFGTWDYQHGCHNRLPGSFNLFGFMGIWIRSSYFHDDWARGFAVLINR